MSFVDASENPGCECRRGGPPRYLTVAILLCGSGTGGIGDSGIGGGARELTCPLYQP